MDKQFVLSALAAESYNFFSGSNICFTISNCNYLFQKIYGAFAYTVKSWYENSKFFRYFKKVINSYLVEMYKTLRAAEILVGAVAGSRAGGDAGLVVPTTLHAAI